VQQGTQSMRTEQHYACSSSTACILCVDSTCCHVPAWHVNQRGTASAPAHLMASFTS
jgi:hypothetical protein